MYKELCSFATRLCEFISNSQFAIRNSQFSELALELFALQFKQNSAYRKICEARGWMPKVVEHWTQIPAVPTAAFKERLRSAPPFFIPAAQQNKSGAAIFTTLNPSRFMKRRSGNGFSFILAIQVNLFS
jgi:hypothetical protein